MLRVSQAYFDVLGAQDTLATTRANKAAISEQLASAKRNFEVGTATITDTREAQARFDLATAQEIAADNDLRHQADRARPAGRPQQRPAAPARRAGRAAGDGGDPGRRARQPRRRGAPGGAARPRRLRHRPARDREGARAAPADGRRGRLGAARPRHDRAPTSPASTPARASASSSTCRSTPAALIQNRIRETLVLEERSRNDLEAARRAVTQTTRAGLLHAAVGHGAGEGARGGGGVEPARARGDAARLPRRHPRQRRRAQRAEPALPDPARSGAGALRPAAEHAAAAPGLGTPGADATSWGSMRCW